MGKVLSVVERAKIKMLDGKGLSVHEIARELARSAGPIQAVLRGDYDTSRSAVPDAEKAEMLALALDGERTADIAARFSRSVSTVAKLLVRGHVAERAGWDPSPLRLSLAEREQILVGLAGGLSFRAIAVGLGWAPSTVSREVGANGGRAGYAAWRAHGRAACEAQRPKTAKLVGCPRLADQVAEWLVELWSPEEISQRLRVEFAHDPMMRVSYETIYQSLYVQGRGALRRELASCLRSGRAVRRSRSRLEHRGQIAGRVMISERPAEVADRAVPGHWEGDLIVGAFGRSAVGTLVERTTRFVLLLHLANAKAETVDEAMRKAIATLPGELFRTVTWDQESEMARHATFSIDTGIQIYFCDPHSPWQRGSNENTNGLLRQYMPKGTDLTVHSVEDLAGFARSLNNRPRKTLNWMKPSERMAELVAMTA